jgi:hypothetical protein
MFETLVGESLMDERLKGKFMFLGNALHWGKDNWLEEVNRVICKVSRLGGRKRPV